MQLKMCADPKVKYGVDDLEGIKTRLQLQGKRLNDFRTVVSEIPLVSFKI